MWQGNTTSIVRVMLGTVRGYWIVDGGWCMVGGRFVASWCDSEWGDQSMVHLTWFESDLIWYVPSAHGAR